MLQQGSTCTKKLTISSLGWKVPGIFNILHCGGRCFGHLEFSMLRCEMEGSLELPVPFYCVGRCNDLHMLQICLHSKTFKIKTGIEGSWSFQIEGEDASGIWSFQFQILKWKDLWNIQFLARARMLQYQVWGGRILEIQKPCFEVEDAFGHLELWRSVSGVEGSLELQFLVLW